MSSWQASMRLAAVMSAVAIGYLVGRWVAEGVQEFVVSGGLPGL